MKTYPIFFLLFNLLLVDSINAQNWQWSKQIGGNSVEEDGSSCLDANNNLYVTGKYFSNPCYFGTDTLSPIGEFDFFIAKYDPAGNELWVKGYGGYNLPFKPEGIFSISYDVFSNSIYFTGSFAGTCIFDTITIYTNGSSDAFVGKADLNGNILWVNKAGGVGDDVGFGVAASADGNVFVEYLLGDYGTIGTNSVDPGVYFAKYDGNGNHLWNKKIFNSNNTSYKLDAVVNTIKIKDDKIFGLGRCFVDTLTIDTLTVYANYPTGQHIITCFDTSANALWIKTCANSDGIGFDILVDNTKNCFITGDFNQEGVFEQDTLHSLATDLFIAKYDSTGHKIWVHQTNATIRANGYGLCFDPDGNIYLTGIIKGTVTFGSFTINPTITSMFLARYDTAGSCMGVRYTSEGYGKSVNTDVGGNVYVCGGFLNTITFDSNPSLISFGNDDIFIARSSAIVGVGELEGNRNAGNELIIFANPNNGVCQVSIPDEFKNESNLTLQIFDNTGRQLQQTKIEIKQGKIKLNLEQEAKGIYQIILSNGKKGYHGKVVFE